MVLKAKVQGQGFNLELELGSSLPILEGGHYSRG
jgi:hypothetical protein